jgi:2-oxoglutarate ferredoxin oxidoreductase subunit alpha
MSQKETKSLTRVAIRFAGDSGDGMQLTGSQFTNSTALAGQDLATFPDYPAEIRAPAGTTFGVSGFQIQFSSDPVHTPGDSPDVLIAMNPAALKVNLNFLRDNAIIILNEDAFTEKNLKLAGCEDDPLNTDKLEAFQVFPVPITKLTRDALEEVNLTVKEKDRCKNFFALGMTYWMYSRSMTPTIEWIENKFKKSPDLVEANKKALNAGYTYALATEIFTTTYKINKAKKKPGVYRNITGNEATALGFIAAAEKAGKKLFLGSYPITPASEILQYLASYKEFGVKTFQAEDEIAGIGAALGAAYTGALAITTTSGPGIALKSEFMGLAVMAELPLVIVDVQRGGPSTGLPTKTEQSDLLQAMYGRNGEAPIPIIAAQSPADCFRAAYEASEKALKYNMPVMLLTDGYIANGAEPWKIPKVEDLQEIKVKIETNPENYKPYDRDPETLSRYITIPGVPGLEHRIGGLEKDESGNVSYEPENHDKMVRIREEKVKIIHKDIIDPELYGKEEGELLVISWGSTHGTVFTVMEKLWRSHASVSWYHMRWINPMPKNLGKIIKRFKKVLVPEINRGQLIKLIRSEYLVDAKGFNKVKGLPLSAEELQDAIESYLKGNDNV